MTDVPCSLQAGRGYTSYAAVQQLRASLKLSDHILCSHLLLHVLPALHLSPYMKMLRVCLSMYIYQDVVFSTRVYCVRCVVLRGSGQDSFDAFSKTVTELDFALTEWNVDPYPNGVHDLPSAVKEALRKGGKLKVFLGDKEREEIRWRSSQDLK